MAADRDLTLLCQAFLDGDLRPEEACRLDRRSRQKIRFTLDFLESRRWHDYLGHLYDLQLRVLDYNTGSQCFDTHWDQAIELQSKLRKELLPWLRGDPRQSAWRQMYDIWKENFGDPNDQAVKARIAETITAMMLAAAENAKKRAQECSTTHLRTKTTRSRLRKVAPPTR